MKKKDIEYHINTEQYRNSEGRCYMKASVENRKFAKIAVDKILRKAKYDHKIPSKADAMGLVALIIHEMITKFAIEEVQERDFLFSKFEEQFIEPLDGEEPRKYAESYFNYTRDFLDELIFNEGRSYLHALIIDMEENNLNIFNIDSFLENNLKVEKDFKRSLNKTVKNLKQMKVIEKGI